MISSQVFAQEFNWGEAVKHEKVDFSENSIVKRYLFSESADGMKRIRVEKVEAIKDALVELEIFDANLELQKTINLFDPLRMDLSFEEIFIRNNKIYIFASLTDSKAKTSSLLIYTYDENGEQIGEEKTLDIIEGTKILSPGEYFIAASENGEHFATIALPTYAKKTKESLQVKTFDADFKEVFGNTISLEHGRKRFVFNTPFIANNGTLYMFKNIKVKKIGRVYEMYALDAIAKKFGATRIELGDNNTIFSMNNKMVETSNGNLLLAGLQKEKKKMRAAKGVFYVEFDKTGKIVNQAVQDFPDAPKYGFTGLDFKSVEQKGNSLYFFADMNGRNMAGGSNFQNPSYVYSGENLFVARLDGDKMVWSSVIERSEIAQSGGKGAMVNWMWNMDKAGNLHVFFNDLHRKYDKTIGKLPSLIPVQVKMDANSGEMQRIPLINAELGKARTRNKHKDDYTFSPEEWYPRNGYLIVKCTNSIDFKLGRLSY